MDDTVAPLFPVPACVVFGRKRAVSVAMPTRVRAYSGWLPMRDASEQVADARLRVTENAPAPSIAQSSGGSAYRGLFRAGAVLFPRVFVQVEEKSLGRLGPNRSNPLVESRRSSLEKEPWRSLESVTSNIESQFIRKMFLGESVAPYLVLQSFDAVLPILDDGIILTESMARKREFTHLANRTARIEKLWADHGKGRYLFSEHLNYMRQLVAQFPIRELRLVYAASGVNPAAALVRDKRAVIEHGLYWIAPSSEDEAYYLMGILNSEVTRSGAKGFQARGQFGARHFDKVAFNLPIPKFSTSEPLHLDLATAGRQAEALAATVPLPPGEGFVRLRGRVRAALSADGIAGTIDGLVARLLGLTPGLTAAAAAATLDAGEDST